ncbi:MAG: serine/threonine-protein kinase [Sandaracinaceae bacterium]
MADLAATLSDAHSAYAETVRSAPGATITPDGSGADSALGLRVSEAKPDAGVEVHEDVLGRGGMSVVFEGTQHSLGRAVAVKSPLVEGIDSHGRTLLREAWITAQLEHPNVVPVYDLVAEAGRPMAVLKRIEGVEWAALIADPDAVTEQFGTGDPLVFHLRTFLQVCNAVHYAHSRGVIHRDLKPENVMVGGFGEVYVVDWGIAVSDTPDGPVSYDPSTLAGTPLYIAPESLMGRPVDARTDVYLLGAILFEVLAGRPARQGTSMASIISQAVADDPPELPDDVPTELASICRRCLSLEPDERFESAVALRSAIERHLEHRGSSALCAAADLDLARLEALAADITDAPPPALAESFAACRVGYRAALSAWADNPDAQEGLLRAVSTMIEVEITHGSAASARTLMAELEDPPASLAARVEDAVDKETRSRRELLAFRADHDPAVGRAGRFIGALLLTPFILASPLAQMFGTESDLAPSRDSVYLFRVGGPVLELFILFGIAVWKREVLTANLYNRRVVHTAALIFAAQVLLSIGHYFGGVDPVMSNTENFAVIAMGLGALAIFVDNRITPALLAYAATFLAATRWPDQRYALVFTANAVLCGTLLFIWRPRRRPV